MGIFSGHVTASTALASSLHLLSARDLLPTASLPPVDALRRRVHGSGTHHHFSLSPYLPAARCLAQRTHAGTLGPGLGTRSPTVPPNPSRGTAPLAPVMPHVQLRVSRHDAEAPRARPSPRNAPVCCKSCTANEREAEREGLPVIALPARRGCSPPPRPCEYRPTTRCGIRVRRALVLS